MLAAGASCFCGLWMVLFSGNSKSPKSSRKSEAAKLRGLLNSSYNDIQKLILSEHGTQNATKESFKEWYCLFPLYRYEINTFYESQLIFSDYNLQQIDQMQKHFNFGHTIVAEDNNEESSQNLLDLFKIGDQQINITKKQQKHISSDENDSDQTVKQKKIKKQKKQKKEKKEKKQKEHKHKDMKDRHKKEKKQKKKREDSQQYKNLQKNQPLVLYDTAKKIELYEKYSKVLQNKTIDEKLAQKFDLNIKLGQGTLNVDVIRFPEPRLYQYGPMDKQIPRYQRLPNFEMIIGFKKSKHRKARKLIRELNKIINQKNVNQFEDEISVNRYFHFEGYQHTGLTNLATEQKILTNDFMLKFNLQETPSATEQESVMKITKEFNRRINENPKNVNLWIEFVKAQDKFSLSIGSLKNKSAVIDRKISILEKALNLNPFNQKLGIFYLSFLFQKQLDHKQIAKKCMEFMRENPSSITLWKFYFSLSIEQFNNFSHTYIRKVFEQMNELFKKTIQKTKSAIQIWKIRKASLQIMKNMLLIYKLQGYSELATGIIIALIQYNIFMPEDAIKLSRTEDKLQLFQKYWEDFHIYKLAETNASNSWSNVIKCCQGDNHQFIGNYQNLQKLKEKIPIMREIKQSQRVWRMSNALKDQKIIENWPESFVLYEDIDFSLMLYRDNDSITTLIDILADHLELPLVFSATSSNNQFSFKLIETFLKRSIKNNDYRFQFLNFNKCCFFWTQYWNPIYTQQIIQEQKIIKMEYFRRVLTSVKQKLPNHKTIINEYLSFLACVIYLSPKVQRLLHISEEQSLKMLSDILQEEPLNLATWCMYIEATYTMKNNQQECIQCFVQLFGTAKLMIQSQQELKKFHLEIFFWLSEFCRVHQIQKQKSLLKILKKILFDQDQEQPFQLNLQINSFDCLQMEQYFRRELQSFFCKQVSKTNKQSPIFKYKEIIFMLQYLEQFPSSSLVGHIEKNTLFLISELESTANSKNNLFIIKLLTTYQLLSHQEIIKYELLTQFPYLMLIQFWAATSKKPFILFLAQFQTLDNKNLPLWMTISMFLWRDRANNHEHLYEYFYIISKKICFEDKLSDQRPEYITLLNELLIYDVNEDHSKFIMYSLHHVPFSKKLYMLNLLLASNESEKQRLLAIIQDKFIRVLDQKILS